MQLTKPLFVRIAAGLGLATAATLLTSCAGTVSRKPAVEIFNDMRQQLKYDTQGESEFAGFTDGRADRRPVAGTIAQGHLHPQDDPFYTGQVNGMYVGQNPLKITPELMELGQQRFNTYCSPCHGRAGTGKGIVATRSTWIPSDLMDARVKGFSDGDFFDVITHGRRTMPSYRFQITEHDRWAIIAYVRALQRTTSATVADVPAQLRGELR
jgi:mono/diheme cytochrome c family protein